MRGVLNRFVSHFPARLDAKGRLSVPAPFRAVLAQDGFKGLYVHPSLDWPALDCGGHALLAAIDSIMEPLPLFGPDRDALALTLLGESDILKMDGEGRIGLTETLKAHAGIETEAVLVGVGQKFQIWEPGRFRTHLAEARRRVAARRHEGAVR